MKRIVSALFILTLLISLCACSKAKPKSTDSSATKKTATENNSATESVTIPTEDTKAPTDMETVQKKGKITVGITNYAPMNYKDENGNWTGFDTEFAKLFAEELGVEVEFFVIPDWDKKFVELETGNIDAVWNGMTITEEATSNASVSNPYVLIAQVVVMKADKIGTIKTAADLKELRVAVEHGSAGQTAAEEAGIKNIVKMVNEADALQEVKSGTVQACIIDITTAKAMTGEGTDYADLVTGIILNQKAYGVAFRKDSDLTAKFNEFMKTLRENGKLEELAKKYNLILADDAN